MVDNTELGAAGLISGPLLGLAPPERVQGVQQKCGGLRDSGDHSAHATSLSSGGTGTDRGGGEGVGIVLRIGVPVKGRFRKNHPAPEE